MTDLFYIYYEGLSSSQNDFSSCGSCSYCNKQFTKELSWCEECDPYCMIKGQTIEYSNIDKFIKDTIYNARQDIGSPRFLEWIPFNRFVNIKQIGEDLLKYFLHYGQMVNQNIIN